MFLLTQLLVFFLIANQEFQYPEIDELITASKKKKPLAEIKVLLDTIRRRSVIIMDAALKNAKKDKKRVTKI
ncbi:MAG: hypothetical protein DRP02_08880 [Candidatus Gerdarchaeota archaeon]|nr:MAG: hypothetical protein DRP02_08880 [Candidatus Gerdarchaeota archaeon]